MKIIQPSVEILTPDSQVAGVEMLRRIESAARISHRSEELQTPVSYDRFLKFVVMTRGDWSVVEHAIATVKFRVDRGVTHELVRHRLFSFTQESTRFVNYKKKGSLEFIEPEGLENPEERYYWFNAIEQAEYAYLHMLEVGATPQRARSILPNALASSIEVTGNLRNWRHFLLMRTSRETHPDFRRVTIPLLMEFKHRIPILFDDIIPDQPQKDAVSMPR